ncbi:MAG: histidine phosphatase family protein [Candidatus Humimicrobiaceae bacterium]
MGVKLFLVRHGQTQWNLEGRYQGDRDIELTPIGVSQGELASRYLSNVNFSNIYSSPLKRALDTANLLNNGRGKEIIIKENLKEINFGKWEGLKFAQINDKYHDDYQNWLEDPFGNPPTEGEDFGSFIGRTSNEISNIVQENKDRSNVAIATHGGVIIALLVHWLRIPKSRWRSLIQRQGAINVAVIHEGFPYVSLVNYTGHLHDVYDESDDKVIEIYSKIKK